MSKQAGKSLKQVRAERASPAAPVSLLVSWMQRIVSWSRLMRTLLVTVFTLAAVAAIFPLIDSIYLAKFFAEETRILPSLITLGVGIIAYAVGWWLLIGLPGDQPLVRRATFIYTFIGLSLLVLVVALLIYGLFLAVLPDS